MALEKVTIEDKIEVVGDYKHVQIREKIAVLEDGVEISSSFHRDSLSPMTRTAKEFDADGKVTKDHTFIDTDISGRSAEVQAVCNAVWTTSVKNAYKAMREAE
tara:strand:+ start:1648 stop:1956 length:309 start_codon:yes stop_codon:yes gene_type:complete